MTRDLIIKGLLATFGLWILLKVKASDVSAGQVVGTLIFGVTFIGLAFVFGCPWDEIVFRTPKAGYRPFLIPGYASVLASLLLTAKKAAALVFRS